MANPSSESQYGFKDKIKAQDSLKLLEKEDLQYQKLTVRGLLGRAKRVLTMTKAEEKIKNISDAIEVFEKWLEENGGGESNKNSKSSTDNDKPETVPGLGFKDKEAALKTLQILEGRDPDYQKLAVKGLIGSSKRVLGGTKNEDKIKAIKDGVNILEEFLEKFDRDNLGKDNLAYLNYNIISVLPKPKNSLLKEFVETYGKNAKGNYKHLRTMYPTEDNKISWDIVRNRELKLLKNKINSKNIPLFNKDNTPTDEHLEMIYWAYSPQPDKVKTYITTIEKKAEKRPASTSSHSSSENDMEDDDSDSDTPSKKKRHQ